jgi:hypothetical protein
MSSNCTTSHEENEEQEKEKERKKQRAGKNLSMSSPFVFSDPLIHPSVCETFSGTAHEKDTMYEMIDEWNARSSVTDLCKRWKKDRPAVRYDASLLIILFNVEGLRTHVTDVDILLNKYKPHVAVLTGVGAAARNMITFPGYKAYSQPGTNAFGGVAILYQEHIICKIIKREANFLLTELQTPIEPLLLGAIYVPPNTLPQFELLNECATKPFYIFGDFNAKHTAWRCRQNNTSGVHLFNWLEETGNEILAPSSNTSRRSDAIIDFGVTHDAAEWTSEVLNEGTSDHWPVLFQSTIAIENTAVFKLTNWKMFSFFLTCAFKYWNSLVYNLDIETFFCLFSSFLPALQDRCSTYRRIDEFKPPWPPSLVLLARKVNSCRRQYRKYRLPRLLEKFLIWKDIFTAERAEYLQQQREKRIQWLGRNNNLWKSVRTSFRPFAPPFKGLSTTNGKITNPKKIVDVLADHYEKHFDAPVMDPTNNIHNEAIDVYTDLSYTPNIPLDQIKLEEVEREWKKFQPKKSLDSAGTSAFILKKLPTEYLGTIAVLFNKCAAEGTFFEKGKIAKVICLSKEGIYPSQNKLRPISLLPNLAKWMERIIHRRILEWCHKNNIAVDEQSGFMQGRRLQTRILSLVENLRLTVAACNRPALTIFVDFLSAFDNMWHPALIRTLKELEMPLPLLKWIHSWLRNRYLYISYGDEASRTIEMNVGAPQGSVLAATLFRLHIHFLPAMFKNLSLHLFADDLAIVLVGSIEKRFSQNINDLEKQAAMAMKQLEKYAKDMLLPVNIPKTKALLVHSVVAPSLPKVKYKDQAVEHVQSFKYLGVTITTKLGWGNYISDRLRKIRGVYKALRSIFTTIPTEYMQMRRKLLLAYALPHFCWLFSTWFYYTEKQRRNIEHTFCSGLRLTYALRGWDDITTMIVCKEKSLLDYLFSYWTRLSEHLERASDALDFQQSWQAYQHATSQDRSWYRSLGFRTNSKFPNRLAKRAQHTLADWTKFRQIHQHQYCFYRSDTLYLNMFVYKYMIDTH